jgi:hypothetical protein
LKQIHSNDKNKLVKQELKQAFIDIVKLEEELDKIEVKMKENPNNLEIIETYTSLLEQFNNI